MPPGGTKRVRATLGSQAAPRVSTRSGKKYTTNHQATADEEQDNLQPLFHEQASMGQGGEEHHPTPVMDWSSFDDQSNVNEDEPSRQVTEHAY